MEAGHGLSGAMCTRPSGTYAIFACTAHVLTASSMTNKFLSDHTGRVFSVHPMKVLTVDEQ